jgi:hypothetical protein
MISTPDRQHAIELIEEAASPQGRDVAAHAKNSACQCGRFAAGERQKD